MEVSINTNQMVLAKNAKKISNSPTGQSRESR